MARSARAAPRLASVADRAARVRFRRAHGADGDDAGRARLRPAGRRQPPGRPDRAADLDRPARSSARWSSSPCSSTGGSLLAGLQRRPAAAAPAGAPGGAVGWAALFVDAWRLGQPLACGSAHRRAVVGVNGLLCLSVAGTLLFGAHLVGVQRDFMIAMFGDGEVTEAHDGRYNVLLLGGDSGAGRWGLRPDSMTVAVDRRGDRPHRADRAAAQHGELPVRRGLGDGRAVPRRVRLRRLLPQRRQHLGRRPHRAVRGSRDPRHRRHHDGGRGHHRTARSTTGRWSTSRASSSWSTPSAA